MSDARTTSSNNLPSSARVVVIGGGIIGTSIAYHLAHMGCDDVVLLERDEITSGTTWHAAGLMVTYGSLSETATEMRKYSKALYARLEAETGQATGINHCGFIELATDRGRLEEYRRVSAFNRYCGVDVHELSAREVQELFPLARVDDVLAGFYVEDDGRVNPVDVTMALARGARMQGATLITGVAVTGINRHRGRVTGVTTDRGDIACEYVVNCAGMWARQLGEQHGVLIPNQAAEHYYLITEPVAGISRQWPVLEDPANYGYYREEVGGLMVGLFEPVAAPWRVEGIPDNFSFGELAPDWGRMTPFLESAMSRVPISLKSGIKKFFCGPESFTPDLAPIVGEAPELDNYFVAAGLNSIGILSAGGLGRIMAHWILNGRPDVDVTGFNIDRFHPYQGNPDYRRDRAVEALGTVYKCHYPTKAPATARNARRSALHERLVAAGACFSEASGWEAPSWYAPPGVEAAPGELSFGRMHWWPYWEREHRACRENVVLMDMSIMSKFLVQGRDAGTVLERISANRVNGATGVITYTQWLNDAGLLEADLTVTKLAEDKFLVVVTDTMHRHAETWMRRHIGDGEFAVITDITAGMTQINIQGPRSRALLQAVTSADLGNEAFPFRCARDIDIGYGRALCIRITYAGELGYELYIASDQAVNVYDRLVAEGANHGLVHAGLRALGSLRLEKGYRDYGHDIDNTDDAFAVGLGFAVALDKPGGFIGQQAAARQQAAGPSQRRLVQVLVEDPEPLLWQAEVIYRDDIAVGYVRAGSYGHTLGGAVGLAMIEPGETVDLQYLQSGHWEIDIAGLRYPCRCSLKPLYDPAMARIKA
ncbi:FAD-dependent oxidoreductase [Seongchinamella sediminis]|uniref:FAD-dependent oxidoreductase n=1 Tax=Seongchinamella sediminis TaxID=2283635 RepID=A0A3L7DZ03_9GAMM|nr:FAD-dependent oxidoreductase [Seongchinamella sediminis]RLQ22446.1 FAD-dependent oxidoreductase [Seongchinamella sediminis]